jgi:hypothetical protein
MKIACFSYFLPWRENRHGPNALLWQIIKERPSCLEIDYFLPFDLLNNAEILSINEVAGILRINIFDWPKNLGAIRVPWLWPAGAKQLYARPLPDLGGYDGVWGYPYWTAPMLKGCHANLVISGMDCAALLYWRRTLTMLKEMRIKGVGRSLAGLFLNTVFERTELRYQRVHTVGLRDADVLRRLGADSRFVAHPLLEYDDAPAARMALRSGPCRALISNSGDVFYGSQRVYRWINSLASHATVKQPIHLLLHRASAEIMEHATAQSEKYEYFTVERLGWCDDYSALLQSVDIQFFPLDIGAGTKTSALTALQHGVVCVGTNVALENIFLAPGALMAIEVDSDACFDDCLKQAVALVQLLRKHRELSPLGGVAFIHNPQEVSKKFWHLFT